MYGSFLFVVAAAFVRVFLQKVSTMGLTCVLILLLRPKREDFISSSDVKAAYQTSSVYDSCLSLSVMNTFLLHVSISLPQ